MQKKILKNCIIDRKSKFTPVQAEIHSKDEIKIFLKALLKDKYFQKASHNSYAYRFVDTKTQKIIEGKNDDGENGAGMCILRELQHADMQNTLVLVSRHFGGVHLGSDRFKYIISATQKILEADG